MVAVFLSGIVGRFIYLQIPHTIEGQELSINDIRAMKTDVAGILKSSHNIDEESYNIITDSLIRYLKKYFDDRNTIHLVKSVLRKHKVPKKEMRQIMDLVNDDIKLNRKMERLATMQNLFKYWHVVHSPFALVMLIIMVIHVGVTIAFGYRWIF
jgi:hypothetical protein